MDFSYGIRKKNKSQVVNHALSDLYPHDLQLFMEPPREQIPLSEFEDLALERLQLLRLLEQATNKGHKTFSDDWMAAVKSDLKKENLPHFKHFLKANALGQSDLDFQARRADHISHCILKLAYCRSEDLRRWFLAREQEWLKFKFMLTTSLGKPEVITKFLELNHLHYTPISKEERDDLRDRLYSSTAGVYDVDNYQFYKLPFDEVCALVKNRRVYLNRGYAYIPHMELVTCVLAIFRAKLSEGLASACLRIPHLDDERLTSLLSSLHTGYVGNDYEASEYKETVNIAHLDKFAKERFPPCMRHLHESFRLTHHLRHYARLQYGLFLKAIGVLYEDAVRFWQEEFCKIMDANSFEKKYSYIIKHMYGKVGRMVSYSPYSCMKIINNSVGPGEQHGCMFRHCDASVLKHKLAEHGIGSQGVEEILELTKNTHYEIACTKYFELTQGQPSKRTITHPNLYYEESIQVLIDKAGIKLNHQKMLANVPINTDETANTQVSQMETVDN